MADLNRPAMDVRRELRFAVVLYGGVSLAVYINGVVQELLGMVRATAPDPTDPTVARFADEELTPTELVYRRLAKVLHSDRINATGPGTIYTRFIVDIVSGTSAAGSTASTSRRRSRTASSSTSWRAYGFNSPT
jgi:hypothetical protein